MKRVLIDLSKLSNLNCGLGQVALNFGKALSNCNTELEFSYLVPDKFIGYFGNSIKYYTIKTIKKAIKTNSFDLWHAIHQDPSILPSGDTKLLLTIHDLNFMEEKNKKKAASRLRKLQKTVSISDKIIFISKFSQDTALNNLLLKKDKTSVIYNGVTSSENETPVKSIDSKFFFSIGVFKSKKNFHVLIPVMKHFPDYKLIIAGDTKGNYYKEIIKLAEKENILSQIVLAGIINEEEKTWLYRNCEAFLFPSLYEGFGLPVIEAMRNKSLVITSNKTSLPEIGGGHTFILDNFDELSIKDCINSSLKEFSNEKKIKAFAYSQKFSWESNAIKYISEYKSILEI